MTKREKVLAGSVVVLLGGLGGQRLYNRFQDAVDARQSQVQAAQIKLHDVNLTVAQGRRALKQVEQWQRRSLPSDREKALTLYKAWLLEMAKKSGLAVTDIKLAPGTLRSTTFSAVGYQLTGSGSLSAITAMLYEFYDSPYLHQITKLQLSRPPGAPQMQVLLDVEALSLPGADAVDKLPEGKSNRLRLASLNDYQKSLGERDLATAYSPPRPPAPKIERRETTQPPKFDDAEQAHFTAALSDGDKWVAWINVRTTGETLHVGAGDPVKVGALDAQVVSIEPKALVVKIGEKNYRVPLGESLRKGKEIGGTSSTPEQPAAETPKS
jgi:hypothetical protein